MKVPLLDLKNQFHQVEAEVRTEIDQVLVTQQFINGPKVQLLEERLAEYLGVRHSIGVSSGTDALLVAMMALDLGPGDIVITTPYSFFATAGCISRLGATPAFVDIDPLSYNLCPKQLEKWLSTHKDHLGSVKACVLVHLYGQAADAEAVQAVLTKHDIKLIEDAAQAIGTKVAIKESTALVGSIGDLGCFSFFPSKNLGAMGDGGLVVTNDSFLAERVRKLKNHGSHPKYYHEYIGGNFRLDAIQAAILLAKLPYLERWHAARRDNAARYDQAFAMINEVVTPYLSGPREHHIYNQYVIRAKERDLLRSHLSDNQIGSEIYYPLPFHLQDCFANLGYKPGDFPTAEAAANETLAIPVFPELTKEAQTHVINSIQEFYA